MRCALLHSSRAGQLPVSSLRSTFHTLQPTWKSLSLCFSHPMRNIFYRINYFAINKRWQHSQPLWIAHCASGLLTVRGEGRSHNEYVANADAGNGANGKRVPQRNATANANEMSFEHGAVSWWLACRLEFSLSLSLWVFAPISTTLTHHRKVQNLNSYHFFDWLSGSINIEFCSVAKAQEKNTPQIHTPHNSRMSQWQWCSFWGQSLDWFGWAFGLSEAAYHAVWVLLHFV